MSDIVNKTKEELFKELESVKQELLDAQEEMETQSWGLEKTNKALRSLYKKLEAQNVELKKLDQLKSDFVSTVSHELRTPLAISTEAINLILDGLAGGINDKQKDLLKTSKENLERLNLIINDLLDISKIEAGKLDLRPVFFDIIAHLEDIADSYRPVADKKKLSLKTKIPAKSIMIYADKDKITQVMTNLLSNAYKFTDANGRIELRLEQKESDVAVSIKDSGRGIEQENIPKLFKKFQQIGREEGPGIKGTGLGLSISKSLVELHGGNIWVESRLGQGTTISFSLPLYEEIKKDFNDRFDSLLGDMGLHRKSLALIIVQIGNYDALSKKITSSATTDVLNQISVLVNNVLSHPDDKSIVYDERSIYIVLPETGRQGAVSVIARIKRCMQQQNITDGSNKVDISYGYAVFPDSAISRESMIELALNEIRRNKKVLVIDDHPQVFKVLKSRLEKKNFELKAALSGQEALNMMEADRPDLVILDIMMPNMDGYEVFGKMKETPALADIPVIILTAKEVATVKKEAPQIGEIPVINKSGNYDDLVELVDKML